MESPVNAPVPSPSLLSPQEYADSRHGVWMSSAALITDGVGRILIVRPSYRTDGKWLLPGGGVEAGESPWQGCLREVREEVGLELGGRAARLLACCWQGPGCERAEHGAPFPGDVMSVFDGGSLNTERIAAIRLQDEEISEAGFHDSARAAALLTPLSARIMLAALRARLAGTGTAYLESGRHIGQPPVLDRHDVHVRPAVATPAAGCPTGRDTGEVRRVSGWLFAPDGRVVLTVDPHPEPAERVPGLPGGTALPQDGTPAAGPVHEAAQEARLILGPGTFPLSSTAGHEHLVAAVSAIGPAKAAPATGRVPLRLLASPEQAAELLGAGDELRRLAAHAAAEAGRLRHLPSAPAGPVTEVPAEGMHW